MSLQCTSVYALPAVFVLNFSKKNTPCNRKWHQTGSCASSGHLISQIKTNTQPAVPPFTHQMADWCSCCLGPASAAGSSWSGPSSSSHSVSPGTPGGWWCSALAPQCRSPSQPALAPASSAAPPAPSAPPLPGPAPPPRTSAPAERRGGGEEGEERR